MFVTRIGGIRVHSSSLKSCYHTSYRQLDAAADLQLSLNCRGARAYVLITDNGVAPSLFLVLQTCVLGIGSDTDFQNLRYEHAEYKNR